MADQFHYPPEVFSLLVDTIPLLCRSKKDVLVFLQGAGIVADDLAEVSRIVHTNLASISKYEIVRNVLTKLNARGDSGLRPRREVIKRVVEFEDYSTCWPTDQLKAKGLVASLREVVNVKDSFTRMKQAHDTEHEQLVTQKRTEQALVAERLAQVEAINSRLSALFSMDDKPQERGKLLEAVLNDMFKAFGIHVREAFCRRDPDSAVVLEQIDGVIELDGTLYLVEIKWLKGPVGVAEFAPHLMRLFSRANASGIFIATNGFTESVVKECRSALNQRTMFLCSLREIVMLLHRKGDLVALLRKKSRAAIIDKNPLLEILD
jgi:hypothetical protein